MSLFLYGLILNTAELFAVVLFAYPLAIYIAYLCRVKLNSAGYWLTLASGWIASALIKTLASIKMENAFLVTFFISLICFGIATVAFHSSEKFKSNKAAE